jgi:CspA family cold shock protein
MRECWRLGVQEKLCYKTLADVEFCDGLRLLTTAACSSERWRKPDGDFLSFYGLTHDLLAMLRAGDPRFLKGNTMTKIGTVKFFNIDKGYGFIQPDDGSSDSFVHVSAVQAAGMHSLDKDQRLNYEVERGRNGKESAINLSQAA